MKNYVNPIIFIKFILFDQINMKYEIRVAELTIPPNFSLIPLKVEKLIKIWTLTPKTKKAVIINRPVVKSSILSWFWRQFVIHLHTTKFCSNRPNDDGNEEGRVRIFKTTYH